MMGAMRKPRPAMTGAVSGVRTGAIASACSLLAIVACGGAAKGADSPGTCPEGTVLSGDNCVPDSAGGRKSSDDEDAPKGNTRGSSSSSSSDLSGSDSSGPGYDKEAVDAQLKRAAKQVQSNCGSASDDEGNKTGPWGATTATVVLGRNGRVADVTVPAPYSGKPVGDCVVNSFKKIQFPPYAGSSDTTVTWDVQIVQPKHK
jgi:hypothetical protein